MTTSSSSVNIYEGSKILTKQGEIKKFVSLYLRQRFTTNEVPEDECDSEAEFIVKYLAGVLCPGKR